MQPGPKLCAREEWNAWNYQDPNGCKHDLLSVVCVLLHFLFVSDTTDNDDDDHDDDDDDGCLISKPKMINSIKRNGLALYN